MPSNPFGSSRPHTPRQVATAAVQALFALTGLVAVAGMMLVVEVSAVMAYATATSSAKAWEDWILQRGVFLALPTNLLTVIAIKIFQESLGEMRRPPA